MIGVVDYEAGNISSVANALRAIGAEFILSASEVDLSKCQGIVLPGVGAARGAMASLEKQKLSAFLSSTKQPFLGICLGMQLFYESSEEGPTKCLGVLPGMIRKFDSSRMKVPHMGWNLVQRKSDHPLMTGLSPREYFYFAHSYFAEPDESAIAAATEQTTFAAVVRRENYFGVQFHPEKSGKAGLQLLRNFVALCASSRQ